VSSALLFCLYLVVMLAGLGCFLQAFRTRHVTAVHRRWGLAGAALSLGGIAVVLLATYLLGWRVEQRLPEVVFWHRRVALVTVFLLILTALTGMLRMRLHRRLYWLFLPLYVLTLLSAAIGYRP